MNIVDLRQPPGFCQYSADVCDQSFTGLRPLRGIFLYPSEPQQLAATLEAAVETLRLVKEGEWVTWKEFAATGQLIFCSICKACRFCDFVVTDVTTLNFNLMFEIGFALGLELPVIPIRDRTYIKDQKEFDELGILDVIGYLDFQNADALVESLAARLPIEPIPAPPNAPSRETPLYVLKAPIKTEGEIRLLSAIKKSPLRFKSYDPLETPRLSLQEARKSVFSSYGIVAHLLSPDRSGARVHNARCALVAGIALAAGKTVLLLQEGQVIQPIDYREIVRSYRSPDEIAKKLEPLILDVIVQFQERPDRTISVPEGLLEKLDLGDVAAENEIRQLRSYFVRTAQYNEAKRGHARLIVGRKGSGKTAIFYALRDSFAKSHSHLILDLKPEGHQFTRLREAVLSTLSPGLQEHTLTAFWNYILLCEIAQKISDYEYSWAHRDPERQQRFMQLVRVYHDLGPADAGDMSERLLRQVERLAERFATGGGFKTGGELTQTLFRDDIRQLDDAVGSYLVDKSELWLLIDNLDKGWPTRGASSIDILILRTLLEATRKLQRQFEERGIAFHSLVFLRNDIYEHLLLETPDKGKETAIALDWDDAELFKEIVRQRVMATTELRGAFDEIWPLICDRYVGTQDSFRFILDRTLMRPRDLLSFLHRAIEVAVNRGHERVLQDDLLRAELSYSEDMFLSLLFELRDVKEDFAEVLYPFLRCPTHMSEKEVCELLENSGLFSSECGSAIDLLVWFGFLGVQELGDDEPVFAHQVRYNLTKVLTPLKRGTGRFVVHPVFWRALDCTAVPGHTHLPLE